MSTPDFIQVPPDAAGGKKVDTRLITVGVNFVERQVVVFADPNDPAGYAAIKATAPSASDYGIVVRPIAPALTVVGGTISVTNFPTTQTVSGTVLVSNFPASQTVAGTVAVSNLPATQTVAGSVAVTNFPATQTVAGTVLVSNLPATQAVSAVALPLPAGAAADATVAAVTTMLSGGSQKTQVTNFPAVAHLNSATDSVSIVGTLTTTSDVTDRAARLLGHVTVDSGSVSVSNLPATQAISATALPLPAGAATDVSLTNGTQRIGGTVGVAGTFWQATQPISGTVTVANATLATDVQDRAARLLGHVTVDSGSVSVSNLPATQAVSAVALPLPAGAATDVSLTNGNLRVGGTTAVSGTFWPATQPISGTVTVANATLATDVQDRAARLLGHVTVDSGSVSVSNLPATQAVSAVALPLPAGAATDASLTNGNARVGGTVAVTGTFWQATQPVSTTDTRALVERMMAKAPAAGYTLWLDVTSSSATSIYIAEAPVGTAATASTFRGALISLDANGAPLGAVQTATSFVWNARSTAPWAA